MTDLIMTLIFIPAIVAAWAIAGLVLVGVVAVVRELLK